jgi:hypothetical protein
VHSVQSRFHSACILPSSVFHFPIVIWGIMVQNSFPILVMKMPPWFRTNGLGGREPLRSTKVCEQPNDYFQEQKRLLQYILFQSFRTGENILPAFSDPSSESGIFRVSGKGGCRIRICASRDFCRAQMVWCTDAAVARAQRIG